MNSKVAVSWKESGIVFSIVKTDMGHYCGYARLPERLVREQGYDGILRYVPVHGGITYAKEHEDGTMEYGFDCAHSGDDARPELKDIEWLKRECRRLAIAIKDAVEFEEGYLLAKDQKAKAEILDSYHKKLEKRGIEFNLQDNFGAMISVLGGNL